MRRLKFSLIAGLSVVIAACGGGGAGGASQQVGQFIDDPVGGLTYSCTSAGSTQTLTGTTDADGHFNFIPGQTCTFKVGNVTLGSLSSIPSDGKVTPQDVAGVSRSATAAPSALAIAQFLQSLNDGTTNGKIVIPAATTTALSNVSAVTLVSSTGSISQADLNTVVAAAGKTLVSAAIAKGALDTQISSGNVAVSTGSVSTNAPKVLNSIAVTSAASSNAAGLTEQMTATGYYSDGSTQDLTNSVNWSSSDTSTATVSTAGVAKGLKKGSATITASLTPSGSTTAVKGSVVQTATDPVLQSMAITHSANPPAGLTDQLTATGTYSDGSTADLTASATWASSNSNTLTVGTSTGLVTGVAKGSATVTASVGTVSSTYSETVVDPTPLNIVISYVTAGLTSLQNTASTALQAVLTLSNNATQTVSSLVNWVVTTVSGGGNATVAVDKTVNSATLTGTSPGVISIAASYLGLNTDSSKNLSLTITPLTSISGTASSGIAMSGASIAATCQGSTTPITTTSSNDGTYQITLPVGVTGPCLLSATSANANSDGTKATYYSAIPSDGNNTAPYVNISPITHLVLASAIGTNPNSGTTLSSIASSLSSNNLTTATSIVQSGLNQSLGVPINALSNPFSAAYAVAPQDSGVPPSPQDAAIDQVMASLNISSTPLSNLASAISGATSGNNAASAISSLATQTGMSTSASTTCPFATSGLYATANVGATNLRNGIPSFGILKIDFSTLTAVNGSGDNFTVTQPNSANPCQFQVASATKNINFQVSRSGFIVATSFAPPDGTLDPTFMSAGTGSVCFKPNSYCSGFQLGFPVQSGITLNDLRGTTQSIEWNLDQYNYFQSNALTPNSSTPCNGVKSSGYTCSVYVGYARQFQVDIPQTGNLANLQIYDCDGLAQNAANSCATQIENSASLTLKMCSDNNDCPTTTYINNGNTVTVQLKSVADIMNGPTIVGRTLVYRSPNNDVIGFFVAGQGGPMNIDGAHSAFGGFEFQEQFGVLYKQGTATLPPTAGNSVNQPQWVVTDWVSSISSATIVGTTMSNVSLGAGTNALVIGQILYNGGLIAGTTIKSVNGSGSSTTYTLVCGSASDCRTDPSNTTSFTNFMAFSEQVKEDTQLYTVGNVNNTSPYTLSRSFSDKADAGVVDNVVIDLPYKGMSYRAYVAATSTTAAMNDSVSLRGSGWNVSIGTATLAQQLGGATAVPTSLGAPNTNIITGCTMPGSKITYSNGSYGCDNTNRKTGKFFTVGLKY